MNIAHIINSIDKSTGGPARSVTLLISALLRNRDYKIDLICGESKNPIGTNFNQMGAVFFCNRNQLGFLKGFNKSIRLLNPDILHGHGLWEMPVHQMARYAKRADTPYIISPRGMLDTWSINHKSFKKNVALKVYQKRDLIHASCLHATSKTEAENIRKLGLTNPIAVIPNGVDLPTLPFSKGHETKKSLLFVARLVKNKGIEELLKAWQVVNPELKRNWDLNIVGEGSKAYEAYLKNYINNDKSVTFLGPLYGKQKQQVFNDADLFVLPTYTENFGIVIAEALATNTPVITTKGAPWEDLEIHQAGWWIDIGVKPLTLALNKALSLSEAELIQMGKNGRTLVEERYSVEVIAKQMLSLYQWILDGGEKPKFVF